MCARNVKAVGEGSKNGRRGEWETGWSGPEFRLPDLGSGEANIEMGEGKTKTGSGMEEEWREERSPEEGREQEES